MQPPPDGKSEPVVFQTEWFDIVTRGADPQCPHYVMRSPDFAAVIAIDSDGNLILVRQYRHGVEQITLELPSGHVDPGETPEETARKELLEETGYVADEFEFLASLSPSTARCGNAIHCFLARNARPAANAVVEQGSELVVFGGGLRGLLREPAFCNAVQFGAIAIALLSGKLRLDG